MTPEEWHDAADLFEQGAYMASDSCETHKRKSCDYAVKRLNALAMWATGKAMDAKKSATTPKTKDENENNRRWPQV